MRAAVYRCLGLILLVCISSPAVSQSDPQSRFRQGVVASRAGDHVAALRHFQTARDAGLDTPALHYNLGVSYYRIGDSEAAARAFRRAARRPEMAAPARYNLGLIALDRDDETEARRRFRQTESLARTAQIRELARTRLRDLDAALARGRAWLGLEGGYDDNVVTGPETQRTSESGDLYADLLLWGDYRLTAPSAPDIRLSGVLNARAHADESDADRLYLEAGPEWHRSTARWRTVSGVRLSRFSLGGDGVENRIVLSADARRQLSGVGVFQARLQLAGVRGGNDFDYLDGYRHALRLGLRDDAAPLPLFLHYDLVYNDRHDLRMANSFQSASPLRQGVMAGIVPRLNRDTLLELSAGYRVSRFRNADELPDGRSIRREDRRLVLESALLRDLGPDWTGTLRLGWTDNRSNRELFDYDRLQISAGVERSF